MNLGRKDERIAFKMFCGLAVIEPGANWPDKKFEWKRGTPHDGIHSRSPCQPPLKMYTCRLLLADQKIHVLSLSLPPPSLSLGFELTQGWMSEEGMMNHGIIYLRYYSGETKRLMGCRPNIASRKGLLHLVLTEEKDLIDFEVCMFYICPKSCIRLFA